MGSAAGVQSPPKLTPWFDAQEIIPYLEEGDLIEFHRDVFQHWAVYVHSEGDKHLVVHLTGGNDNDIVALSSETVSGPLKECFGICVECSTSGFQTGSSESSNLRSYLRASVKDAETAEVTCHTLSDVAGTSKCRVNNGKDHDFLPFSPEQISTRAISEIGRRKYNLLVTNCEHFAKWCRYGSKSSNQTTNVKTLAVGTAVAAFSGSFGVGLTAGAVCLVACHLCNKVRNKVSRKLELMW